MIEIKRGVHLLGQAAAGIVGDPHVLLFEHHVELGTHDLVGEHEAGDAVGLERHHLLQVLARHALKEAGIVVGGEGVLLAADRGNCLRKPVARILRGAFEHQVFEEMRQTGFSGRFVGGADLVPDHVGDDRRAMIRHDHDFKTVAEREAGNLGVGGGVSGTRQGGDQREGNEQNLRHECGLQSGLRHPKTTAWHAQQARRQNTPHDGQRRAVNLTPRCYFPGFVAGLAETGLVAAGFAAAGAAALVAAGGFAAVGLAAVACPLFFLSGPMP